MWLRNIKFYKLTEIILVYIAACLWYWWMRKNGIVLTGGNVFRELLLTKKSRQNTQTGFIWKHFKPFFEIETNKTSKTMKGHIETKQ